MGGYWRFAAMIVTSTLVMFALMYVQTYQIEHVYFSETRTYMALVMGATMAIVMLSFMLGMYTNRTVNLAIYAGAAVVLVGAIYLARSQTLVGEVSYMKAMIPHHSTAILTSERATITDPRARKLADQIIKSQHEEIAQMRALIAELEGR
jgi:hypothetical protein